MKRRRLLDGDIEDIDAILEIQQRFVANVVSGNIDELEKIFFNELKTEEEREELLEGDSEESPSPLIWAADSGRANVISWLFLVAGQKSALRRAEDLSTPLHTAAQGGHLEACQALLAHCLDRERTVLLKALDENGCTALHHAAFNNHAPVISWLLSREVRAIGFNNILATMCNSNDGNTALHLAIERGHLEACQAIVMRCTEEERQQLFNGTSDGLIEPILFRALRQDQLKIDDDDDHDDERKERTTTEIIRWLSSVSNEGRYASCFPKCRFFPLEMSALHLAAQLQGGNLERCKVLVNGCKDADDREYFINATDSSGQTVLHYAALNGNSSIINWILSSEPDGGRAAGFKGLLAKNSPLQCTALELAVENGCLEACQALVKGCIDKAEREELINEKNKDRETLLHVAARGNHSSVISWLLSDSPEGGRAAGFNQVLATHSNEYTALMSVIGEKDCLEAFQTLVNSCTLLERIEILNAADDEQRTLLYLAAFYNQDALVSWLLSDSPQGGRVAGFCRITEKTLLEGRTPMHAAAREGHLRSCKALASGLNADERAQMMNELDVDGSTILHLAAEERNSSVIAWILSETSADGARVFQHLLAEKGDTGETALRIAIGNGDLDSCQALVDGCMDDKEREALVNALLPSGSHRLVVSDKGLLVIAWCLRPFLSRLNIQPAIRELLEFHTDQIATLKTVEAVRSYSKIDRSLGEWIQGGHYTGKRRECSPLLLSVTYPPDRFLYSAHKPFCCLQREPSKYENVFKSARKAIESGPLNDFKIALGRLRKKEGSESLRTLLNDVDLDECKFTFLQSAAMFDRPSFIEWLLSEKGGRALGFENVLAKSEGEGLTALLIAARKGRLECCRAIIDGCQEENGERSAMINSVDHDGYTVLHLAAYSYDAATVSWVLSAEPGGGLAAGFQKTNAKTTMQEHTALHIAAERGALESCQAILEGVSKKDRRFLLGCKDYKKRTALQIAVKYGYSSVASFLTSAARGKKPGATVAAAVMEAAAITEAEAARSRSRSARSFDFVFGVRKNESGDGTNKEQN